MSNFSNSFIERVLNREKEAFNILYFDTVDRFYRFLKNSYFLEEAEIEDILSNTYFKIRKGLKSYKSQNFEGRIWTILRNTTIDFFKKSKEVGFGEINSSHEKETHFEDMIESEEDIIDSIEKDFEFSQIENMLKKLNIEEREILYMKFIEEKNYEEISTLLGIKYDNVRQKLSRALKKLQKMSKNSN